jgi:hypothetical protein
MLAQGRYPTQEEIEASIARARRMRSEYVAALFASAALRARQFYSGARERRGLDDALALWRECRRVASWLLFRAARSLHPDLR